MPTKKTTNGNSSSPTIPVSEENTGTDFVPSTENYLKGPLAKQALMRGVKAVHDAVAPTMGPKGKDALIAAFEWPYSVSTNDGASVASRVVCENAFEQMGVRLMQESMGRANKESGDGSTTTCVITNALLEEGMKHVYDVNIKRELDTLLPQVLYELDKKSTEASPEDITAIATVSAQDEEMGKLIGEIYADIGPRGVIDWQNSYDETTSYEIKNGIEVRDMQFVHKSFINSSQHGMVNDPRLGDRIVLTHPNILMISEKIFNLQQIGKYADILQNQGIYEMVLVCDEIEPIVLAEIEYNVIRAAQESRKSFKVIALRAPVIHKDWWYEDMALLTGATVVGGPSVSLRQGASMSTFGTCDKLVAKKGSVDLIGTSDISSHIASLTEKAKSHRELEKRLEFLNAKTAVVSMGARSEVELSYKRLKFEDAKNAAKLAMQSGIIIGGGIVLTEIAERIDESTIGGKLMKEALKAPQKRIELNSGISISRKELEKQKVYDPVSVAKNALKASVSVAGTVLNCETLIPLDMSLYQNQTGYAR